MDLGEGIQQVGPVHEVKVRRIGVADSLDGDDIVVQRLQLGHGAGSEALLRDQARELLLRACIAEAVGQDSGAGEVGVAHDELELCQRVIRGCW